MGSDFGSIIGLGVDLAFFTIFYTWFKKINKSADEIKKAPYYKLDDNLLKEVSKGKTIPYACVEGEVMPVKQVLHSKHVEGQIGVIQHTLLEEHKSQRIQGVWTDVKNAIADKVQTVPFLLKRWLGKESKTEIRVEEPTAANYLMGELTTTYDSFEPTSAGNMVSRGIDRIFGEVNKGYHETERMLLTNTLLLGIGEITLVENKLHLRPPQNGKMYVLTKMSRGEVIKHLENKSFWVRVMLVSTGAIGAAILLHIFYKYYKQWKSDRARLNFISEVRNLRKQAEERVELEDSAETCVVCLNNRREIVLLECGHICLCAECLVIMPEPLTCPVCRSPVDRYITTYNP